ncbi:hypothetical protein DFH27DRAFT_611632 [Peziza echinospora]|nr:hypothetical protein DFH27DRAFT_611632 [Peziza echinospora]
MENTKSSRSALVLEFAYPNHHDGSLAIVDLPGSEALETRMCSTGGAQDPRLAVDYMHRIASLRMAMISNRTLSPSAIYSMTLDGRQPASVTVLAPTADKNIQELKDIPAMYEGLGMRLQQRHSRAFFHSW